MERRSMFAIFGVGAAAPAIADEKPANGQCPVCGTMAEPYKGEPVSYTINCTTGFSPTCTFEPIYIESGPRITRCAKCNAAFWQESE